MTQLVVTEVVTLGGENNEVARVVVVLHLVFVVHHFAGGKWAAQHALRDYAVHMLSTFFQVHIRAGAKGLDLCPADGPTQLPPYRLGSRV